MIKLWSKNGSEMNKNILKFPFFFFCSVLLNPALYTTISLNTVLSVKVVYVFMT